MAHISAKTGKSLDNLRGQLVALGDNSIGVIENRVQETYEFKGKKEGKVLVTRLNKETYEPEGRKMICNPETLTHIGYID